MMVVGADMFVSIEARLSRVVGERADGTYLPAYEGIQKCV